MDTLTVPGQGVYDVMIKVFLVVRPTTKKNKYVFSCVRALHLDYQICV